jgi:hypothetical protein
VAHNQAVVLPTLWRQLDQGHPVAYRGGDVDMAGPDEAGNAYVPGARERVLEGVAWLVEEVGEGRVKARHAEPIRVLCLLRRANPQPEEKSQNRRVRE